MKTAAHRHMTIQIERLSNPAEAMQLLESCGLTTSDLTASSTVVFGIRDAGQLIATAGIDATGSTALLRSVATSPTHRGKKLAKQLVSHAELFAKECGATSIALLTTSAESFFADLGYVHTQRENAPLCIQHSTQFKSLCPASATVMFKHIN